MVGLNIASKRVGAVVVVVKGFVGDDCLWTAVRRNAALWGECVEKFHTPFGQCNDHEFWNCVVGQTMVACLVAITDGVDVSFNVRDMCLGCTKNNADVNVGHCNLQTLELRSWKFQILPCCGGARCRQRLHTEVVWCGR